MSSTKQNILDAARVLFNDRGYSHVTIRMIAQKLNMSSGNLNYHFKKRDDILETLYFDMVATFDKRIDSLDAQTPTLKKMLIDVQSSMERMVDYKFFWTDLYNILSLSKKIKTHFNTVYNRRKKGLNFVFDSFINSAILNAFEVEQERDFLIERMINFGNTWLYASVLYEEKKLTTLYITSQTNTLMFLLYPYLTHKGKTEIKTLIPKYFAY